MNRPLLSSQTNKTLWRYLAIAFIAIAPVALFAAFFERSSDLGKPITTPHPLATTTQSGQNPYVGVPITGQAAIVYDLSNGQTLFSQNADRTLPLASLTKLLSVYAGVRQLEPTTPITLSSSSVAVEGESGLLAGETFAFADLARFALVGSSNDAAQAITEELSRRTGTPTSALMASAAVSVGLSATQATNGTGLDIDLLTSGGYGSARDIALLAGELVKQAPGIAKATTHPAISMQSAAGVTHSVSNTNQGAVAVPGILLSKTGYTDLAGGNLVVVFDSGIDHPIAVVVLGSTIEGRFTDVNRLVRATQQHFAGLPAR